MIEFSGDLANFIINETRKNNNSMDDENWEMIGINNYKMTRQTDSSFEKLYLFDEQKK